jgi:hypothetical protein
LIHVPEANSGAMGELFSETTVSEETIGLLLPAKRLMAELSKPSGPKPFA